MAREAGDVEALRVPLWRTASLIVGAFSLGGIAVNTQRDVSQSKDSIAELRDDVRGIRDALDKGFVSVKDMQTWVRIARAANGNNGVRFPDFPVAGSSKERDDR